LGAGTSSAKADGTHQMKKRNIQINRSMGIKIKLKPNNRQVDQEPFLQFLIVITENRRIFMNQIIYLVGLVVVVMAILSLVGLRP
jgi:hypothetical protein